MRLLFIVFVACFSVQLTQHVAAQTLSQIETLTTEDGLPFRDVASIAQDSLGFMWFGTTQGLLKYDGYSFKIYNNDPNNPYFIEKELLTEHNTIYRDTSFLWYAANNSLFRLNVKTDSITAFNDIHGIKGGVIELHMDHDDQVWIVSENHWTSKTTDTKQYLQKYDNDNRFKTIDSVKRGDREFTKLISDAQNNIWWTTIHGGTKKYTSKGKQLDVLGLDWWSDLSKKMTNQTSSQQYQVRPTFARVNEASRTSTNYGGSLFFDQDNNHYYFPIDNGIVKYNPNLNQFEPLLNAPVNIYHALEDNEGNTWFAGEAFLFSMDRFGNLTNLTEHVQQYLDFTNISQLFLDNNGLLWIATDKGLLKLRIKPQVFKQLFKSDEQGWGNSMRSIFETKDTTIIAMYERGKKLVVFDKIDNQLNNLEIWGDYPETVSPLHGARFFAMDLNKEYVYTVSDYFVRIRLKDGQTTLFPEFASRINITGPNPITTLRDGRLLFGFTLAKLTIYDPKTKESELVFTNYPENDIINLRYFEESKTPGIVWIGTLNDGLLKLNLNGTIESHYHIQSEPALNKNNIMVVHEDRNENLWLGTFGGGLNYLNLKEQNVTVYDEQNGLAQNNVVGILPYRDKHLFISTYEGLSFLNTSTGSFQNYFVEDGLSHNEFNYTSFYKDREGHYYFGGMNGINKFHPRDLVLDTLTNPLLFTSLTRFNSKSNDVIKTDLSYTKSAEITISPYDQYFQIDWTIPNYFKNVSNQYFTKLEGYETEWFSQGTDPYVRYNKLPHGDYVLHVKGTDFSGTESQNILKTPITVKPIYYKTWWFILLCVLAILALVYGFIQFRVKQLLAVEKLRTKISSDLHDDLGSMLSGIAMQSELLEANAKRENKGKLNKIANLSRNAVSNMRDLVWSIDNRRERISDLIERMEELAEELLFPKGIGFSIEKNNLNLSKKLPVIAKQHLLFIYKEAVTNILKHSNAQNVSVIFTNQNDLGKVMIKDDGTLVTNGKSTGFGLSNMVLRAQKMNAKINFIKEDGFQIHLKLPFKL